MKFDDRIKLSIFEGETTYKNDYREPDLEDRLKFKWRPSRTEKPEKELVKVGQLCHETFAPIQNDIYIPFHLLHERRPILDPPVCSRLKPPRNLDHGKEETRKSRPRLYMPPAVSIDDVPDEEMHKLLISYMYTTDFRKAEREAVSFLFARKQKETEIKREMLCCCGEDDENSKEFKFMVQDLPRPYMPKKPELLPAIPGNLRRYYKIWDKHQKRAVVDPDIVFWENKDPPIKGPDYNPLDDLVHQNLKNEIAGLLKENKLRYPHDITLQGFAGYKPTTAKVVDLKKIEFPIEHPMVTTNQAVYSRYEANSLKK